MNKSVVSLSNPTSPRPTYVIEVDSGTTIEDLAPDVKGLLVCRLNGGPDYVHRDDWSKYHVTEGDLVEFIEYPQAEYLLYIVIGMLVVTAYMVSRIRKPNIADVKRESVYNTALTGNLANPDAPIPRICGRMRIQPPFAGTPYSEYDAEGDQYYYALFAIGVGKYDIERDLIDDTSITHFGDVLTHSYLAPGVGPSQVLANVITAPEVTGQELLTGAPVGAFAACGPAFQAEYIGIDIVAPRGLAHQEDDGSMSNLTVSWQVTYRTIDDFGAATSAWIELANETRTANKIKPQRWSNKYTITPARVEVRVVRTDVKSDSSRDSHEIVWEGLRAYLANVAPLNPNVAHYEVVMRASEQLNQTTQRSITLFVKAYCRTLNADLEWQPEVYTRNPAWWILDLATSDVWGINMPDSRIDLQSFYEYAQIWEERQDRFDYEFSSTMDAWEAMQLIATAGRARVFRRQGVLSIARDELATLPVTAFTTRNTRPNSMVTEETMATTDMPDGYIVEYMSNRTWLWTAINCPCDGVVTMERPIIVRLPGITGAKHAEREGKYLAARLQYRRRQVSCTTEMQGLLPSYMAPVRWMPEVYGYGQTGDVVDWDTDTLTMTLSEPPKWTTSNYLTLMRDDGTLTNPVIVTIGLNDHEVILPTEPDFTIVCHDATRERPKFLFGRATYSDDLVRVTAISDGGEDDNGVQLINIAGEIDDERVHTADNTLLPLPGEVQDDVTPADEVVDDTDPVTPSPSDIVRLDDLYMPVLDTMGTIPTLFLKNTGRASYYTWLGYETNIASQWLSRTVDPTVAGLYEARITPLTGVIVGSPTDVWLPLSSDVIWSCAGTAIGYVEIRIAATEVVQDYATITFEAFSDE